MIYLTDEQLTRLTKRIEKQNLKEKGESLGWSCLYDKLCLNFAEEIIEDTIAFTEENYIKGIDYLKSLK